MPEKTALQENDKKIHALTKSPTDDIVRTS